MRASLCLTLALLSCSCASYRGTCPDVESFRPLRGHGVTVISDIDDTIKDTHVKLGRTHIPNPAIIFDGLHSWHRVNEMARVYKEKWSSLRATTIIYVSAGPCCYAPRLKRSIKEWEFPIGPVAGLSGWSVITWSDVTQLSEMQEQLSRSRRLATRLQNQGNLSDH